MTPFIECEMSGDGLGPESRVSLVPRPRTNNITWTLEKATLDSQSDHLDCYSCYAVFDLRKSS